MEDDRTTILNFLNQYEDFTQSDKESGYKNVYRPSWHPNPMQFWFNPPFDETGKSNPTLSGDIILLEDGTIMVENMRDRLFYNLGECLGDSLLSFALTIKTTNE